MRDAFAAELTVLGGECRELVFLSGDIGNRLYDKYKEQYPDRFLNCGVAEANMIGMAAGLALCGLRPVAYTITPFITTRCLEQIRVDLCYHNLPAIVVGVGAGLSYATLGGTHHACEDIAFLRVLPHMTVICPGDAWEARAALRGALEVDGPVYIRLGKKGEPKVHERAPSFAVGKGIVLHEGKDACLLSTGNTLPIAVAAGEKLKAGGVSAGVVSLHTVKPLDEELLSEVFARYRVVVTIEEHSRIGGLGGAVAEWLADHPAPKARLLRIGTPDAFFHEAGEQEYAREKLGLTSQAIAEKTLAALR